MTFRGRITHIFIHVAKGETYTRNRAGNEQLQLKDFWS